MRLRTHYVFQLFALVVFLFSRSSVWSGAYKVGPGDILHIQVIAEQEFTGLFQVNPEGSIDYPFVHKIAVSGLSLDQVDDLLTSLLKKGYLKDPQVSVAIKEYQSQRVLVLGSVIRPGRYILSEETRLLDLISLAGGLSGAGGKRILLFREKSETTKTTAPLVETVPSSLPSTPVALPSTVPVIPLSTLEASLPNMIPTVVDYFGLVHDGKMDQNIILHDGDIINVPKANEVFVLGNVSKPGPIKFEDKMTILQAVTLSGGPTVTASTKSTYVLRHGLKGEEKISVRLDKILESKAPNFPLEADDVVVIPESFF